MEHPSRARLELVLFALWSRCLIISHKVMQLMRLLLEETPLRLAVALAVLSSSHRRHHLAALVFAGGVQTGLERRVSFWRYSCMAAFERRRTLVTCVCFQRVINNDGRFSFHPSTTWLMAGTFKLFLGDVLDQLFALD